VNRSHHLCLDSLFQPLYSLRVLCSHGLPEPSVKDVFQATVLAKITYSLPAWFGFCTAADRNRLDSFLRRCIKQGFWSSSNTPSISAVAEDVEDTLFNKITRCDYHILQSYLSDRLKYTIILGNAITIRF